MNAGDVKTAARLSQNEWTIECGATGCATSLADVAWVDINFNIATNAPENASLPAPLEELPAPHLRRYRMAVMFPPEWVWKRGSKRWVCEDGTPSRRRRTLPSERVVRGSWSTSQLGQQGVPPFDIVCFNCGAVQVVEAERRTGVPEPPK
jgi:hypothetical protein